MGAVITFPAHGLVADSATLTTYAAQTRATPSSSKIGGPSA